MAGTTTSTQQTGNTPAPPSEDIQAKLQEAIARAELAEAAVVEKERQYQSVQGNLTQTVTERKKLEDQLAALSTESEKTKGEILAEKKSLEDAIKAKETFESTLTAQLSEKEETLETLNLIITEFPELADWYGKGRIRTQGLKGDELKTFLAGWQEDLEAGQIQKKRQSGQVPPPPPGQQTAMTYQQIQDKKVAVLREKGSRSQEYQDLLKAEEEVFKQGKYK